MLNLRKLTAPALILGSMLAAGTIAMAQEGVPTNPPPTANSDHRSMMNRSGSMMGMGMMNGVDPAQMNRMAENCNRMMERMMGSSPPNEPSAPPAAAPKG